MIVPVQHFLRQSTFKKGKLFRFSARTILNSKNGLCRKMSTDVNPITPSESNPSKFNDLKQRRITEVKLSMDYFKNIINDIPDAAAKVETFITPDRIGIVKFNTIDSKINIISCDFIQKLYAAVTQLNESPDVDIIVLRSSTPASFLAGMDINLFDSFSPENMVLAIKSFQNFNRFLLDGCKPTVAIVEGVCLGGGLEIALSCTFCVAVDSPRVNFAFPEVMLGLVPAGLGTYLSFSKCAHIPILEMLVSGKNVNAQQAHKIGIVSHILSTIENANQCFPKSESDILRILNINKKTAQVVQNKSQLRVSQSLPELLWKPNNLGSYLKKKYINEFLTGMFLLPTFVFHNNILKKTQGDYPATTHILSLYTTFLRCCSDLEKFSDDYINTEAQTFGFLVSTPESKKLREIFFEKRQISKSLPKVSTTKTIKNLAVLGSGLMGQGIAEVSLNKAKYDVVVKDVSDEILAHALNSVMKSLESKVKSKRMTNYGASLYMNKFQVTTNYADLANSDIVIEAVPEILKLKQQVLKELEHVVSPNCIIASNTSAIPISEIAKFSTRPQNVIGMHYFSPVPKMELLEIVRAEKTSPETLAIALKVGQQQGKMCVVVKDSPGFFTTRVLTAVLAECADLIDDGYTPEMIDKEFKEFGFPVAAFVLMDDIGIDTIYHIIDFLSTQLGPSFNIMRDNIYSHLNSSGALGRKVKSGFYRYDDDKSRGMYNLHSREFFEYAKWLDNFIEPAPSPSDIMPRILARFSNEVCKCLEEGIIVSPQVGDIASVFGIGFPPLHKGPFAYIDKITPDVIIADLAKYETQRNTDAFQPCNLLLDMAKNKTKFYPTTVAK